MATAFDEFVLIRVRMSADDRQVMVAPGVELSADSVDIVCDVPRFEGEAYPLLMFFGCPVEREKFASEVDDWPNVEAREFDANLDR